MGEVGVCGIVPMEASLCPRHSKRVMSTVLGDSLGCRDSHVWGSGARPELEMGGSCCRP